MWLALGQDLSYPSELVSAGAELLQQLGQDPAGREHSGARRPACRPPAHACRRRERQLSTLAAQSHLPSHAARFYSSLAAQSTIQGQLAAAAYLASSKNKALPGISVTQLTSHLNMHIKDFFSHALEVHTRLYPGIELSEIVPVKAAYVTSTIVHAKWKEFSKQLFPTGFAGATGEPPPPLYPPLSLGARPSLSAIPRSPAHPPFSFSLLLSSLHNSDRHGGDRRSLLRARLAPLLPGQMPHVDRLHRSIIGLSPPRVPPPFAVGPHPRGGADVGRLLAEARRAVINNRAAVPIAAGRAGPFMAAVKSRPRRDQQATVDDCLAVGRPRLRLWTHRPSGEPYNRGN